MLMNIRVKYEKYYTVKVYNRPDIMKYEHEMAKTYIFNVENFRLR